MLNEDLSVEGNPEIPGSAAPLDEVLDDSFEEPLALEGEDSLSEEDLDLELQKATEETETDTDLVKKLRGFLKVKLEDYRSKVAGDQSQTAEPDELLTGLFGFDVDRGVPTAHEFARQLVAKDQNVATQALMDLASQQIREDGWTIGHEFLQRIGLDPYKIDDLIRFSKGEIQSNFTVETVPDVVPREYQEAYKSLSQVVRDDLELYLEGSQEQKSSALQILRNEQYRIDNERENQRRADEFNKNFENSVLAEAETKLDETYSTLLDNVKKNPAFTTIPISSDPSVDAMVKGSIISQITALGDPNRLISRQAMDNFKQIGVDVNYDEIQKLMKAVEDNTLIAVKAEKAQGRDRRDYRIQIQDALQRKAASETKLLAMANKIFAQSLSKFKPNAQTTVPNGLPTSIQGTPVSSQPKAGVRSFADLDALTSQIVQGIKANNAD